jgi:opacity protein-like surface antigen
VALDFSAYYAGEDITEQMTDEFGTPIDLSSQRDTGALMTAGGGVSVAVAGPIVADVLYRYNYSWAGQDAAGSTNRWGSPSA